MAANPYIEGPFAPVDDEVTAFDLNVRGEIPEALSGRFLRIGPNPIDPDPATHHWFVGSGLVHGVEIEGGRALSYRSRFVRDDHVVAARGGEPVPGPLGPVGGGVANTNIIEHAGRIFAIVEAGGFPVELDGELETVGRSDFDGTLAQGFTAHPKVDPDTGEIHASVYSPLDEDVHYVVVDTNGRCRRDVRVPLPHKPMIHDCAITKNYFIIFDFPCLFDADALVQGASLPYRWHPEQGARVGLLPREGDADSVRWFGIDPCFAFHPMNAHEDATGQVVIEIIRHPAMFATDLRGPNEGPPTLDRWTLDPRTGVAKEERLDDRGQEFPRIDERLIGKAYRYGYTACVGETLLSSTIQKHDLTKGTATTHDEGDHRKFFEPVFVPAHEHAEEDEGFVLAYVADLERDATDVVILDARNFGAAPLATIELPARVPFGFHGNWVPNPAD